MKKRVFPLFIIFSILSGGMAFFPFAAFAQIPLEIGIGTTGYVTDLVEYIATAYKFIIGVTGILAAVMIMFNGLRWIQAAGNSERITEAKDGVISALIGLVIALLSWLILYLINPKLVVLPKIDVPRLTFKQECGGLQDTVNFEEEIASKYPDLAKYYSYVGSGEPCMNKTLFEHFVSALKLLQTNSSYTGMEFIITSVYRSDEQQAEAYACYQKRNPDDTCSADCRSCNPAANPESSKGSSHQMARAMDLGWTGPTYATNSYLLKASWHDLCMVNQDFGNFVYAADGSNKLYCTVETYNSVYALNALFDSVGLHHISNEWWHHDLAGGYSAGQYKANQ